MILGVGKRGVERIVRNSALCLSDLCCYISVGGFDCILKSQAEQMLTCILPVQFVCQYGSDHPAGDLSSKNHG